MSETTIQPTALPTGTATFVFTDIEGSTKLVQQIGTERWRQILEDHHRLLREQWQAFDGREVNTEGDAFFVAFPSAANAVAACAAAQQVLAAYAWPEGISIKVRMGLHTGEAQVTEAADYLGIDVHRAARIASAGHGGQVLVSESTRALVAGALPDHVTLLDLGEHRLKDLIRAEHIYQLVLPGLPSEFPPLKSLDATPNNLPTQMTTFVGRDEEVARAHELLHTVRLLTLTGPGGTGKTRLSVQVAADIAGEFQGVYFVPLAPIDDPELVPTTIARALGLQESGQKTPVEMIVENLASRKVLLVLDNFEQVIEAAPAVGEILRAAPEVKVIASSRAPLRVYGEQEFPVPPLGVPDTHKLPPLESLSQYAAVKLFIDRATSIKPDFQIDNENAPAIAEITELVDGLPLAVELAAARIRLLPPRQMLARLQTSLGELGGGSRDLPARQQTLRGAISWSYDMLDESTRSLARCFSVFARGATLPDAEEVCGPGDGGVSDVLGGLEHLVEQSLMRILEEGDEPRFLMLHVIREFAHDRLAESPEEETGARRRHAEVFLRLAEEAAPQLITDEQNRWLDRLEADQDNLRAALACFVGETDVAKAVRMVKALWRFWQMRGHIREGRERIDEVLALDFPESEQETLLSALDAAGGLTWWAGDRDACRHYYERAVEVARSLNDKPLLAQALYNLTFPLGEVEPEAGLKMGLEAAALFEEIGDEVGAARAAFSTSGSYGVLGQFEKALEAAEDTMPIFRERGLRFDLAWQLHQVGWAYVKLGRLTEAAPTLIESIEYLAEAHDQVGMSIVLGDFSDLAFAMAEDLDGMRLRGASNAIQERTGGGLEGIIGLTYNQRYRQEGPQTPDEQKALDDGLAMSADDALELARDLAARLGSKTA
ncbi:MAG TPA: adenylate/guanylate cyclase domain-containing protein [Candidatus Solibacter sp.]|nr:adenylate/guanylate cyclase domain-containing protein [Candidatus Solibacter sp.]